MIVKIQPAGKSFSGLATYLTHDPDQAKTTERVAWTHTINCPSDDVPCAVNEMLWTVRDAEALKQEAGVRAGGRAIQSPVKHFSLSWSPQENPTREHMIETTKDFLCHMGWQDHQAALIAHDDKEYAHVHGMLNMVHPETGLRLNDSFEQRRAQEWALQYEREHGIFCEQRLLDPEEREHNPPRNIWMQFWVNQKEFEKAEKSLTEYTPNIPDDEKIRKNNEWQILKAIQRDERMAFFDEGKSEFRELRASIFREVRGEFRGRWADYYAAERDGGDSDQLAALKEQLVADQKAVLEGRRDEACKELRESRNEHYRELLDDQRELRAHLRWCQENGLDNLPFLQSVQGRDVTQDISTAFREAAEATTRPAGEEPNERVGGEADEARESARGDAGPAGAAPALFTAFDSLLSIFEGSRPAPRASPVESGSFESAAQEALKRDREREDAEEREKHRALYGE